MDPKKTNRDKILAFEMYCYGRLLTNQEIRKRLNIKNVIQAVMRRKLGLFVHIIM